MRLWVIPAATFLLSNRLPAAPPPHPQGPPDAGWFIAGIATPAVLVIISLMVFIGAAFALWRLYHFLRDWLIRRHEERKAVMGVLHEGRFTQDGRLVYRKSLGACLLVGGILALVTMIGLILLFASGDKPNETTPLDVGVFWGIFMIVGVLFLAWHNEMTLDFTHRHYERRRGFWPVCRQCRGSFDDLSHLEVQSDVDSESKIRNWRIFLHWKEDRQAKYLCAVFHSRRDEKRLSLEIEEQFVKTFNLPVCTAIQD